MNVISIDIGSSWTKAFLINTRQHRIVKADAVPTFPQELDTTLSFLISNLTIDTQEKIIVTSSVTGFSEQARKFLSGKYGSSVEVVDQRHLKMAVKKIFSNRKSLVLDWGQSLYALVDNFEEVRSYFLSFSNDFKESTITSAEIENFVLNKLDNPNYVSATLFEYTLDLACYYSVTKELLAHLFTSEHKDKENLLPVAPMVEEIYLTGLLPSFARKNDLLKVLGDVLEGDFGAQIYLDTNCSLWALASLAKVGVDLKNFVNSNQFENLAGIYVFEEARNVDLLPAQERELDLSLDSLVQIKLDDKISVTQKVAEYGRTIKAGTLGIVFDARNKPVDISSKTGQEELIKYHNLIS